MRRQFEAFGARGQLGAKLTLSFGDTHVVIISSADGASVRSDFWPKFGGLLRHGAGDVLTLHFTLGVDNDTGVVLEVEEEALSAANWLALADNNSWHNLLSKLWLTLLDGGKEHVTDGGGWETGHAWTDARDGDHVQVLGSSVVSAVHDGSNWQTVGNLKFDTRSAPFPLFLLSTDCVN